MLVTELWGLWRRGAEDGKELARKQLNQLGCQSCAGWTLWQEGGRPARTHSTAGLGPAVSTLGQGNGGGAHRAGRGRQEGEGNAARAGHPILTSPLCWWDCGGNSDRQMTVLKQQAGADGR